MKLLITGGAGFIGSHLCDYYLSKGNDVTVLDNFITGRRSNVAYASVRIVEHDVSKPIYFEDSIDAILHFASPASPVDYAKFPIPTLKAGALGTYNALGLAKEKKAVFLLASTSEVYGDPLVHPQPESYWGNVNTIGPRGVYDEAKRYAEAITMAYHREHKIDTKIVRIFNTYGERMRLKDGRAIPNFMSQAITGKPITVYGDGSQTRSLCYVSDLVEGIDRLLRSNEHEPVNLGNPNEVTMLQLANGIQRLARSKSEIVFEPLPVDDPKQRRPDITRARTLLGWEPKVKLEDGLNRTYDYFYKESTRTT